MISLFVLLTCVFEVATNSTQELLVMPKLGDDRAVIMPADCVHDFQHQYCFVGKFLEALDGDSFVLEDSFGDQVVIQLQVQAPELDQPYGHKARKQLEKMLSKEQKIYCRCVDILPSPDQGLKVVLAFVYLGKYEYRQEEKEGHFGDVEQELLRLGFAQAGMRQVGRRYVESPNQKEARLEERNLWSQSVAEPPWVYRRRKPRRRLQSTLQSPPVRPARLPVAIWQKRAAYTDSLP